MKQYSQEQLVEIDMLVTDFTKNTLGDYAPSHMCFTICYPLSLYLQNLGYQNTMVAGRYQNESHPKNGTPHFWLQLNDDLKISPKDNGDLTEWAKQGVLLLNAVLTVEKDKAASHRNLGWEPMTDYIIKLLNLKNKPVVFILWGNFAKEKAKLITNPQHYIIMSPHPSPFSAYSGFFGSKPFSKTNEFLIKNGLVPIDWSK